MHNAHEQICKKKGHGTCVRRLNGNVHLLVALAYPTARGANPTARRRRVGGVELLEAIITVLLLAAALAYVIEQ